MSVQEFRTRVQTRISEVRTRVQARGLRGQQMQLGGGRLAEQIRTRVRAPVLAGQQVRVGGGALAEQVRRRADMVSRRAMERRPGVIPMVKELRLGERVRGFLPQVTDRGDMSVMDEGAYPADGRGISIMPE